MRIVCLNLDHRSDRWQLASKEFEKYSLNVERFSAIKNEDRFLSFNLSMVAILSTIKEVTLVFEDDVKFVNDKLNEVLLTAPNDWQILYLSGNVTDNLKHESGHWWRCKNTYTTHSVIYKPEAAEIILKKYNPYKDVIYDAFLFQQIQPILKCYICKPYITTQRVSYSDLWLQDADYGILDTQSKLL